MYLADLDFGVKEADKVTMLSSCAPEGGDTQLSRLPNKVIPESCTLKNVKPGNVTKKSRCKRAIVLCD